MTTNNQRLTALGLLGLYTKKVGGNRLSSGKKMEHGTVVWAEFEGSAERQSFYFNKYLPDDTPWLDRFMSLEELHKTSKPVRSKKGSSERIEWLQFLETLCHSVLPDSSQKTEGQGRHPNHRTARPIGHNVYA